MKAKTFFKGILAIVLLVAIAGGAFFGITYLLTRARKNNFFKQYAALVANPGLVKNQRMEFWQGKVKSVSDTGGSGFQLVIIPQKDGVPQEDMSFEIYYPHTPLPENIKKNDYVVVSGNLDVAQSKPYEDPPFLIIFARAKDSLYKQKKYIFFDGFSKKK